MKQREQILIVDDMEINRAILCELFQAEYEVLEAENGLQALQLVRSNRESIAVILLDIVMPVMDGFQLMERLQVDGTLSRIPVILITADTYRENEIKGLNLGASDIIMKPFDPHIVKKRVQNSVELYRHKNHLEDLVDYQTKKLTETNDFIVDALSTVIEYRSLESGKHIRRIRVFTKTLLDCIASDCPEYQLTRKEMDTIVSASAMHDIGKISIPDAILLKPGRLTPAEFEIMKTHTTKGCEILQHFGRMEDKAYLRFCYNICRFHHERWDGKGYPDGLKGDEIPVCAQVVSIADVYDALTSNRVYKPAFSHEEAVRMILEGECGCFSPRLLLCFEKVSGKFQKIGAAYRDGKEDLQAVVQWSQEELAEQKEADRLQLAKDLKEASSVLQKETLERDALINAIPGGVAKVVIDDSFRVLLASDGFYKLTGYTRAEFHGEPLDGRGASIILEEDLSKMTATVADQLNRAVPIFVEYRIRKKNGAIAWISAHGSPVEMERGILVCQAVFIDCTAIKQAEQKLLSLMNSVPGGIAQVVVADKPLINYASDGFYKLTGYTREEYAERFPGESILESVYPEDRAELLEKIREIVSSGRRHVTLECRIIRKDGSVAWHMISGARTEDENGQPCYQCVFTDITESRQAQELLHMNEERNRIIIEQVQDIIFEWDLQRDWMYTSPVFRQKFGYDLPTENYFSTILQAGIIHPDDIAPFCELHDCLLLGQPYVEKEYRLKRIQGDYLWCRIRGTVIYDQDHRPLRVVGTASDVDEYKRENALLEARAQKDLLTGLFNKITMETLIENYLIGEGKDRTHALFIIDIDNFKQINDTYGHMEGDAVLRKISGSIRRSFRPDDILGRAGGDEFVVFLKNIPSADTVREKAKSLKEVFHATVNEVDAAAISGSIGISVYPQDGETFRELFRNADAALYDSKRKGKDCYTIYSEQGGNSLNS